MSNNKRPLSVTILACVYIAVGTIGFAYHFSELGAVRAAQYDSVLVELVEIVAIVCGAFMLRGRNWARWLALAWIVFHVILSAFRNLREFGIHCLFCALIAWILFQSAARRYFGAARLEPPRC